MHVDTLVGKPPRELQLRAARPAAAPVVSDGRRARERRTWLMLGSILVLATVVRVWAINATGLNSDEAVYNGQGASIAGVKELAPYFPTFRAHPLLFQVILSIGFHLDSPELFGRLASAAFGVATVAVTYALGKLLYGRRAGLIAALFLALMPYHVIVTRQVLLDGPMVFWATCSLYCVARWALTERALWLYAAAGGLGLTVLSKESSIIMVGAVYAFIALTPAIRLQWRHLIGPGMVLFAIILTFPLSLALAGASKTGGNFVAYQLFRRPNHEWTFYPAQVPLAIGLLIVAGAAVGLWALRRDGSWRETLLLAWAAVPVAFFQIFPVKGFQYLLPIAPVAAVLAARTLAHVDWRILTRRFPRVRPYIAGVVVGVFALSIAIPTWARVQPSDSATFLAGSGGVPGGREAGRWIRDHVPVGARMMSVGPSMANILQYYGYRKIYGLSVSPNPLHRNPVYEPLKNPDRSIRENDLQYVVWDAFSADRSPFFADKVLRYSDRYNGRIVHTESVGVKDASGKTVQTPVIVIIEVRP